MIGTEPSSKPPELSGYSGWSSYSGNTTRALGIFRLVKLLRKYSKLSLNSGWSSHSGTIKDLRIIRLAKLLRYHQDREREREGGGPLFLPGGCCL